MFTILEIKSTRPESYPEGAKVANTDGELPIHIAFESGNVPVLKLLLESYPEGAEEKRKRLDFIGFVWRLTTGRPKQQRQDDSS